MKFTTIILLTACLTASAHGFSQQITLSGKNMALTQVFKEIQKQSGFTFLYTEDIIKEAGTVTVTLRNASLQEAVVACLKGKGLTFEIIDRTVVIKKQAGEPKKEISALPIDVKGHILNDAGDPVIASIQVKGTQNGTASNADGYFELKNVDENATLVITGVNIETKEINVNGKPDITIHVIIRITAQEEVVINAGYYTVKNRERTGNISRVDAKTIGQQPVSNPLQALQGRVAGLQITQNTGVPGGSISVRIRGQNSLRSNANNPLYIIDGIPYGSSAMGSFSASYSITRQGSPLSNINPADIESIEVLKDADATAIYGSRGANGVILITTKKGKPGKVNLDVNVYSGSGEVTRMMNLLNTEQYLEMRREALQNDGQVAGTVNADDDLIVWDQNRFTDWQEKLIGGTANVTNVQANISAGNQYTQFLLGGGYNKETTVFPGDLPYNKRSAHLSLTHKSPDTKFNSTLSVSYFSEKSNLISADFTSVALTLPPNAPSIYDSEGKLNWENSTWTNPFSNLETKYKSNTENLLANGFFSYELVPGLELKSNLGFNTIQLKETTVYPLSFYNPAWGYTSGQTYFADNKIKTWNIEPQLEYKRDLHNGKINILIGATFQESTGDAQSFYATGFSSDALLENLNSASTIQPIEVSQAQYRYNSIFGRLGYSLKGKYFFNATGRRDGSSRFGPGKQFANFWALGTAWIFSENDFIQNAISFLSFGKIRASYGTTGNDQIGDYGYLNTWSSIPLPYQGTSGLYPTRLFNADYSWESTKKWEAALDLGLFKDRIQFSVIYYRNRSSNQLVGYPLPLITGFSSVQNNLPAQVENSGFEFEISALTIKAKEFSWKIAANLSVPRNKLLDYPGIEASVYANAYVIGKPLSVVKAIQATGVDPLTGLYQFADLNNDGNISYPDDLQALQATMQKFFGGIQNSFQYKGIQLDIFFQFVKQKGYSYVAGGFGTPGMYGNQPDIVMNRWRKPGDMTTIQQFTQDYGSAAYAAYENSTYYSDYIVTDASFVRLKNLALSYQLPGKYLRKIHLQNLKVYLQGQNLITITHYLGMDPETQSQSTLPPLKMLTAGIQITL